MCVCMSVREKNILSYRFGYVCMYACITKDPGASALSRTGMFACVYVCTYVSCMYVKTAQLRVVLRLDGNVRGDMPYVCMYACIKRDSGASALSRTGMFACVYVCMHVCS